MVVMIATLFVVAACSEEAIPTQEPVEFHPTAAAETDRPDSTDSDSTIAVGEPNGSDGDVGAGEKLFSNCSACHSTDGSKIVGPSMSGIYARAGDRTSLDADAYIEQSLRDPNAFVVDDYPAAMASFDHFSDDDVKNIIAYLKTLN